MSALGGVHGAAEPSRDPLAEPLGVLTGDADERRRVHDAGRRGRCPCTPVGRTTVTLIFPWASTRNESDSTRDGRLRGAVHARAGGAGVAVDRRDVHDVAPALLDHLVVDRADAVEHALDVDVDRRSQASAACA